MKKTSLISLLMFAAMLLTVFPALAKGPAQLIEIQLPGRNEPLRVEEDALLAELSFGGLEDISQPRATPTTLANGVLLTRYFVDERGNEIPFDQVIYFSDIEGGAGYVHYLGLVNGSSEYDGRWFLAREESAAVLTQLLAENGYFTAAAASEQATSQPAVLLVAGGLALGLVAGWLLAQRPGWLGRLKGETGTA